MVRLITSVFVASALSMACGGGHNSEPNTPSTASQEPQFANDEARAHACTALRDHAIILFADDWADREGVGLHSPEERAALYDGWYEQLAKRGTLQRFQAACAQTLTPRKFQCGMRSHNPDSLVNCLKVGSATAVTQGQPVRSRE